MSMKAIFQNTILISISFVIAYYTVFGPRGIVQYCAMSRQFEQEKRGLARLSKSVEKLKQTINIQKSCPFELEKIARYDFAMGHTNEIIYVLAKE